MLQEVFEVACVLGAADVDVGALSVLFVVLPLALVDVALGGLPDAVALLLACLPLPLVLLALGPEEGAYSVSFSQEVGPYVGACLCFLCSAGFESFVEQSLEQLLSGYEYTFAVSFSVFGLSAVDVLFLDGNLEVIFFDQHADIKGGLNGDILHEVVGDCFLVLGQLEDLPLAGYRAVGLQLADS